MLFFHLFHLLPDIRAVKENGERNSPLKRKLVAVRVCKRKIANLCIYSTRNTALVTSEIILGTVLIVNTHYFPTLRTNNIFRIGLYALAFFIGINKGNIGQCFCYQRDRCNTALIAGISAAELIIREILYFERNALIIELKIKVCILPFLAFLLVKSRLF